MNCGSAETTRASASASPTKARPNLRSDPPTTASPADVGSASSQHWRQRGGTSPPRTVSRSGVNSTRHPPAETLSSGSRDRRWPRRRCRRQPCRSLAAGSADGDDRRAMAGNLRRSRAPDDSLRAGVNRGMRGAADDRAASRQDRCHRSAAPLRAAQHRRLARRTVPETARPGRGRRCRRYNVQLERDRPVLRRKRRRLPRDTWTASPCGGSCATFPPGAAPRVGTGRAGDVPRLRLERLHRRPVIPTRRLGDLSEGVCGHQWGIASVAVGSAWSGSRCSAESASGNATSTMRVVNLADSEHDDDRPRLPQRS